MRGRHQRPAPHLGSVIQRSRASLARHRTTRWLQTNLHVRPNTIKYRIQKARDKLRVTTSDGRIDIALALVLCNQLGAAVLTNDAT